MSELVPRCVTSQLSIARQPTWIVCYRVRCQSCVLIAQQSWAEEMNQDMAERPTKHDRFDDVCDKEGMMNISEHSVL